jgi:hypothetical protein
MISFVNGKKYPFSMRFCPPGQECVPFITLTIMHGERSEPVIGKMDTGAPTTILNKETAKMLGITLPSDDTPGAKTGKTANNSEFKYWVYHISFSFYDDRDNLCIFPIRAGFSRQIQNNLFGCDWLYHFCLGIDRESIHLLRN